MCSQVHAEIHPWWLKMPTRVTGQPANLARGSKEKATAWIPKWHLSLASYGLWRANYWNAATGFLFYFCNFQHIQVQMFGPNSMTLEFGQLVHYCGPDLNISTTIGWIVIKCGSDYSCSRNDELWLLWWSSHFLCIHV